MKYHVKKQGQDYKIMEGLVEVAEVRALRSGSFEIQVHGIVWAEDGTPNKHSGRAVTTEPKLFDALVIAAQTATALAIVG